MNFTGNIIVVTGASRGLGKVLCDVLHNIGATVIGIYNTTKIDTEYESYKCDITNEKEVNKTITKIVNVHEKIDVLINNANLCLDNDIYDKTGKEFLKVLNTNLVGTFLMSKYASKYMESGVIINISSTDAQDTYSTFSMDYAASKAGIENLTKSLALRFSNIKVCSLAPAWIDTETTLEMNPHYLDEELKRTNQKALLKKEDVAMKIIEMIVNNDDYVTGEIIRMDDKNE